MTTNTTTDLVLGERFWNKVRICPSTKCWVWTAAHNSTGYGQFAIQGAPKSTHRLTYEVFVGPIPEGLTIDHLCLNKSCCNPAHLEAVSIAENIRRAAALITHCVKGHALSGANLRLRPNGRRQCRTCDRDAAAAHRARVRAERAAAGNPVRRYRRSA